MRTYTVKFANVTISAVQDLISAYSGASMAVELHGLVLGQITGTTVQELQISVKRLPATVTPGTVGSAPTPQKTQRNDAAATFTSRVNDTTPAATSGTPAILHSDVWNLVNGYQFFWPKDDRPDAGLSEALIVSLDSAPSGAIVCSGTAYFGEKI